MDEKERQTYYIPTNYTESGKYLYGMVSGRNLLEMLIVCIPLALFLYPLTSSLALGLRVVIMLVVLVPLGAFLAIGIDDGSVGQYLVRIFKYVFIQKNYHLERINYVETEDTEEKH